MLEPIRILIVEDRPADRELVVRELHRAGFEPDWSCVDNEAAYLAELKPDLDLVISDYSLPQFSGLRAVELLRARGLEIPFILISGTIGEDTAVEAMRRGATDYLLKDRLGRLGQAVRQALVQRRLLREQARILGELRASEERFRQVVENIREVFWMTDAKDGRMLYLSPGFEVIWGRTCESVYAAPGEWLASIFPADRERATAAKRAGGNYDETYRIVRPNGALRWIRDRAFPIRDESGAVHRIVGLAEDITERQGLEAQVRQAQKMEAIGQLSGGVAHDFNNLLTAIKGHASLLATFPALDQDSAESVQEITRAADRAANLTQQLLTFSRKGVLALQDLDLSAVVKNMTKMLGRILGEDVRVQLDCPAEPMPVHGDAGMLEQVVVNLAVNGRDAMPGGGRLALTTAGVVLTETDVAGRPGARSGSFVRLTVADTGTGITPENLAHIFEPFFTTKDIGKGTGLGLATVYGIVQQHRGWITVESAVGHGTRFHVYLPRLARFAPAAAAEPKTLAGPLGHETILLVEDEATVREFARIVLARQGYRVIAASNGVEAFALWTRHAAEIQLLLTDLLMPEGMSGRQLAAKILRENPALPVIYTSGYSAEIAGRDFANEENFLPKPFDVDALTGLVRATLDKPGVIHRSGEGEGI